MASFHSAAQTARNRSERCHVAQTDVLRSNVVQPQL